jgi:hypothetical protein|tara:strand:- start:473 stop:970 length:498 start_codon:yes stop_codon:yes gene_type:complete
MKIITLIVALISLTSGAFALTDKEIADELFIQLKKQSFMDVQQNLYLGGPPHGPVRSVVEGSINNQKTIVKFNYGGPDITLEKVTKDPKKWLKAITVMQKRLNYDQENQDWFWAKYKPDGTLFVENNQVRMGKDSGCIGCHQSASGNDLTFKHNETVNANVTVVN